MTSTPKIEVLLKILRLEESRGCPDSAVFGGLDRFLRRLTQEEASDSRVRDLLRQGVLQVSYAGLSPVQRLAWSKTLLNHLRETPSGRSPRPHARNKTARGSVAGQSPVRGTSTSLSMDSLVAELKSVNSRTASLLRRLGVATIRDLFYLFPNRHRDFSKLRKIGEIKAGEEQTVIGQVWEARETTLGRFKKAAEAVIGDDTGNVRAVWFNQPYLARTFVTNSRVVLSGKATLFKGRPVFESPEYEVLRGDDSSGLVHTGRLVPVYPVTEGLSPRTLRRAVQEALSVGVPLAREFLPQSIIKRVGLLELPTAIYQAHYPEHNASKDAARHRLAFDELFLMQLGVLQRRMALDAVTRSLSLDVDREALGAFLSSLPFALTASQTRVLDEILSDMQHLDRPMTRLLQGEVGSGKTVVALAALLVAAANGYQGAIMAPTEVLAEQHFLNVAQLLSGLDPLDRAVHWFSFSLNPKGPSLVVGLLIGSLPAKAKREMQRRIALGSIDIVIGTQALVQSGVEMPRLALAVADEQHRFGVLQRTSLRSKGDSPHFLAMSATPIPRTLALTVYGDLDVSTIDELPSGRQPITTRRVPAGKRQAAYDFLRKEIDGGRQAFVICPFIEESETVRARAAAKEYQRLSDHIFPDLRLGLLHGRMSLKEKRQVMDGFRNGEIDVLVSTPVVEVGIDVPNATVMLIEGADRFGLAQIHQLRGRVGRGRYPSYCFMLAESPSGEAQDRLAAAEKYRDGFTLAEADLRFRGPGDYFGTRQSGLPTLRMARISDRALLATAREEARVLLEKDPTLAGNASLASEMQRYLGTVMDETN